MMDDEQDTSMADYDNLVAKPNYAQELASAGKAYGEHGRFQVGDLVCWKAHMRNLPLPKYSAPAVVVAIDVKPSDPAQSELMHSPVVTRVDMYIGVIDGSGDFVVLEADSSRFDKWNA